MWLPFWWTILNPALLRAFRSFRHDRVGGFLDSYFHQLFFAFKLVYFFRKSLQVAFYGSSDVFEGFFAFLPGLCILAVRQLAEYPPSGSSRRIL
jgi:hypothetical protein